MKKFILHVLAFTAVLLVIYSGLTDWESNFYNKNHLNKRGADIFSKMIAEAIDSLKNSR